MAIFSPTSPQTKGFRRRAFTLVELILVLVILAILVGMAVPAFTTSTAKQGAQDASIQLLALTQYARSQAIAEGTNYRLIFDQPNRAYYLLKLDNQAGADSYGSFIELGVEVGRPHPIPDGVAVELDTTPPPYLVQQSQATGAILPDAPTGDLPYIEFYPSGRIDPAAIKVSAVTGQVFNVVCLGPSESFRIIVDDKVTKN